MITEAERQHQARNLAFRLARNNPPCMGRLFWWTAIESAHASARNSAAAAAAAAPAIALCARCDCRQLCGELAVIDRYTGLAAGAAYRNGQRRSPARAATGRPALNTAS